MAALLKRWLIGTHQGAVSREHLDYYLDEYTFDSIDDALVTGKALLPACTTGRDRWAHDLFRDGLTPTRQADRPTTRCGVVGSEVHTPMVLFRLLGFSRRDVHNELGAFVDVAGKLFPWAIRHALIVACAGDRFQPGGFSN